MTKPDSSADTSAVVAPSVSPIRDARVAIDSQTTDDVRTYYDEKTDAYLKSFGEVFQGSRPASTYEFLSYVMQSSDLRDGMAILDAGCGVCG